MPGPKDPAYSRNARIGTRLQGESLSDRQIGTRL